MRWPCGRGKSESRKAKIGITVIEAALHLGIHLGFGWGGGLTIIYWDEENVMRKKTLGCFCLALSTVFLSFCIGVGAAQADGAATRISMLEALKIANEVVPGRVVEAELEEEEEVLLYEIEIISNDGMIVEVQVDANSGHIIKQATEGEVAYISVEEAINKAMEFLRWHVQEIELEEEDGKAVYEMELKNNLGDTQELEIDALSGKVLEPEPKESEKAKD